MICRKGVGEKKPHWHRPACVIGAESRKVFVSYGAKVYRCAPEQVRRVDGETQELLGWLPDHVVVSKDTVLERGRGNLVELDRGPFPPESEREQEEQTDDQMEDVVGHAAQGSGEAIDRSGEIGDGDVEIENLS